jgi:hypothetical protein
MYIDSLTIAGLLVALTAAASILKASFKQSGRRRRNGPGS